MADTGFLSCTATENAANTFFESGWANSSGTLILMLANTGTNTCKDFSSDTISGTVNGAEVYLIDTYGYNNANASLNIQISINGGSSFSSAISTGAMGTTNTQDLTVGGSSQLWGLDWSGWVDISELSVRVVSTRLDGTGVGYTVCAEIEAKIYYGAGAEIHLKQGTIKLSGGTFKF